MKLSWSTVTRASLDLWPWFQRTLWSLRCRPIKSGIKSGHLFTACLTCKYDKLSSLTLNSVSLNARRLLWPRHAINYHLWFWILQQTYMVDNAPGSIQILDFFLCWHCALSSQDADKSVTQIHGYSKVFQPSSLLSWVPVVTVISSILTPSRPSPWLWRRQYVQWCTRSQCEGDKHHSWQPDQCIHSSRPSQRFYNLQLLVVTMESDDSVACSNGLWRRL